MKLILIEGGPASGKNTLSELLLIELNKLENNNVLLDLDTYVEKYNPSWTWESEPQKEKDKLNASTDLIKDVDKHLQDKYTVIVIGKRLLTINDVAQFVSSLKTKCPIHLVHLRVPYTLREQRLHQRGPHSLINLEKDQKDRDAIKHWPGYVYENINSPKVDSMNILKLIQQNKGVMSFPK